MAALPTQVIEIPIDGGLNEKYDPRVIGPGSWLTIENLVYKQHNALEKRAGYGTVGLSTVGGGSLSDVRKLDVLGDSLVALTRPEGKLPVMHTYADVALGVTPEWSTQGTACPMSLSRRTVSRAAAAIQRVNQAVTANGLMVYTWYIQGVGTLYKVVDEETGSVLIDSGLAPYVSVDVNNVPQTDWHTTFKVDLGVVFVGHDPVTQELFASVFDTATLGWSAPTVLVSNRLAWDATPQNGSNFVVLYDVAGVPTVGVWDALTMTLQSSSAIAPALPTIDLASVQCRESTGVIYAVLGVRATGVVFARVLDASCVPISALVTVASAINNLQAVVAGRDASGNLLAMWTCEFGFTTPPWPCTRARKMSVAGTLFGTKTQHSARIWAKPYVQNGLVYAMLTRFVKPTAVVPEDTGALLFCVDGDGSGFVGGMDTSIPMTVVGNVAQYEAVTNPITALPPIMETQPFPHMVRHSTYHLSAPMLVLTGVNTQVTIRTFAGYDIAMSSGFDRVDVDHDPLQPALWQTTHVQSCLAMSGGTVRWFDGQSCAELGFLKAPIIYSTSITAGTGSIEGPPNLHDPPYKYSYVARYEWFDEQGNLHLSAPSIIAQISVDHVNSNATNRMVISCLHYTVKRLQAGYRARDVRIAIFRTTKNSDSIFYRISPPATLAYVSVTNPISLLDSLQPVVTFDDAFSDAQMLANGWGTLILPEQGGALDNDTPPTATYTTTHKNRLWATSIDDDKAVLYSKVFVRGEGPGFSQLQQARLDSSDRPVVAMAPLDDKLVIFTDSEIYYVFGDGPADTGAGGSFSEPMLVSSNAGCINARSIVANDQGVYFQSKSGFYLLSTGLQLTFIGEPVKLTLEDYHEVVDALHDGKRAWILWLVRRASGTAPASKWVIYDYQVNAWTTWSTASMAAGGVVSHALYDERHVWTDGAAVCVEGQGTLGYDPGPAWITATLETPWVKVAGIGGYQRLKHVIITAEAKSAHSVRATIYNDFATAPTQTVTLSTLAMTGIPVERLDIHVKEQKASAIKIKLQDLDNIVTAPADPTGFSIAGLSLLVGVKTGVAKVPANNRR